MHGQVNQAAYGSTIAQMAHSSEPVARQRELPDQLEQLLKAQEYLENTVNELENRLSPVTRTNPPMPNSEGKLAAAPPTTGYGSSLYERVQFTNRTADRLQDLMRRLEV